jgi:hypothetical protein
MGGRANYLEDFDFGNDAGDDEPPEVLDSYFVQIESINSFLSNSQRLYVATAKKGVGKSALLNWSAYNISSKEPDALVIRCTGADITRKQFGLTSTLDDSNDYIKDWMIRICSYTNRKLAETIKLALTDDKITLVETAEIEGFKSRNIVSCLLDRFNRILGDILCH